MASASAVCLPPDRSCSTSGGNRRSGALPVLIACTSTRLAGSCSVRPVHPFADEPAKRVLVQAIKTGRAPLRLLPPLLLHDRAGGKHTAEAEAILRGETALPF